MDIVAAAEQGAEESDLLGRRFGDSVSVAGSLRAIARARVIERREFGLKASDFILRHRPVVVEGA
jgi:hypothetical protein